MALLQIVLWSTKQGIHTQYIYSCSQTSCNILLGTTNVYTWYRQFSSLNQNMVLIIDYIIYRPELLCESDVPVEDDCVAVHLPHRQGERVLGLVRGDTRHQQTRAWHGEFDYHDTDIEYWMDNWTVSDVTGHAGVIGQGTNLLFAQPKIFFLRNPSGTFRDIHW